MLWYGRCRMMGDWKVELVEDNISEFHVEFHGPKDSEPVFGAGGRGTEAGQHSGVRSAGSVVSGRLPKKRPEKTSSLARAGAAQAPTTAACGRSTWNCRRRTPTSRPQLAL